MNSNRYSLVAGIALLVTSIAFFALPSLLDYDAFIPVMLSIFCLVSGVGVLIGGRKG